MLISIQELINGDIISLENGNSIAQIRQPVVDPKNGKIIGFDVRVGFMAKRLVLSSMDIVEWQRMALLIHDGGDLVESDKIVRIHNLLKKRSRVLGKKAKTKSGDKIGFITDLFVDTTSGMIVKYVVGHSIFSNFLEEGRIIGANLVEKIDRKAVIFKDSVREGTKEKSTQTKTATA